MDSAVSAGGIEKIKFRLMVKRPITNKQAKILASEFIEKTENGISDAELFRNYCTFEFDILSIEGEVLYKGKRDKGEEQIWWQL
ncbi:hypothetical protein [Paenibacillus gansuensis]|uniref:Uncharacterized protein n=1 Tax=Paenibacillus gansuensis TaxID=306542 RepID=A0ABW5PCH6_9BACL